MEHQTSFRFQHKTAITVAGLLIVTSFFGVGKSLGKAIPKLDERPILAIWRASDGGRFGNFDAPYLRLAIWNDGRVLFAVNAKKWGHDLRSGRIPAYRVERLKEALIDTGVFELKGHCYLGPHLPIDCIMIDLGKKRRQQLYWLEGQTGWMRSKPHRMQFVRAWSAVNNLGLIACPDTFKESEDSFTSVPESWHLKKAIQSE